MAGSNCSSRPADWMGWVATLLGIGGLVWLSRSRPWQAAEPETGDDEYVVEESEPADSEGADREDAVTGPLEPVR